MAKRTTRSRTANRSKTAETSETFPAATEPVSDQATDRGAPETQATSPRFEPTEEEIRARAYRRYLERGGQDGLDFEDWIEAERELKGL